MTDRWRVSAVFEQSPSRVSAVLAQFPAALAGVLGLNRAGAVRA